MNERNGEIKMKDLGRDGEPMWKGNTEFETRY